MPLNGRNDECLREIVGERTHMCLCWVVSRSSGRFGEKRRGEIKQLTERGRQLKSYKGQFYEKLWESGKSCEKG